MTRQCTWYCKQIRIFYRAQTERHCMNAIKWWGKKKTCVLGNVHANFSQAAVAWYWQAEDDTQHISLLGVGFQPNSTFSNYFTAIPNVLLWYIFPLCPSIKLLSVFTSYFHHFVKDWPALTHRVIQGSLEREDDLWCYNLDVVLFKIL